MHEYEDLARIGYDAYGAAADWKNYQGKPMPQWNELPPDIRMKWRAATAAIVENSQQGSRPSSR